jgi:hypothetical protein
MKKITYPSSKNYVGQSGQFSQAYATVKVIGPTGSVATTIWGLVDTGAVFTQFPQVIATTIGLPQSASIKQTVMLADGSTTVMDLYLNVNFEFEGKRLPPTKILFHPSGNSPSIIGLETIQAAIELGFDSTNWHWL